MIRLLRGLIYGIAAGVAAAFVIDYLDNRTKIVSGPQKLIEQPEPRSDADADADPNDNLSDDARQALLDELGAQL